MHQRILCKSTSDIVVYPMGKHTGMSGRCIPAPPPPPPPPFSFWPPLEGLQCHGWSLPHANAVCLKHRADLPIVIPSETALDSTEAGISMDLNHVYQRITALTDSSRLDHVPENAQNVADGSPQILSICQEHLTAALPLKLYPDPPQDCGTLKGKNPQPYIIITIWWFDETLRANPKS